MPVARAFGTLILALGLLPVPGAASAPLGRSLQVRSTAEDDAFVQAAVPDLLGRAWAPADRERWQRPLEQGRPRSSVAREMTRTGAHARIHVTRLFQRILGRAPDPAGRDHWAGRVVAGLSTASLASRLYASDEFSALGPGRGAAFVDRMYEVALGRPADPAGRAHWIARLAAGEHRTVMARQFFLAPESNRLRVRGHYVELLRRPPDPAESTAWTEWLRAGDDLGLVATLVGSPEYLKMAARLLYDPLYRPTRSSHTITAGNGPSLDPAVSGDGRYVVFSSTATDLVPGDANGHADVFLADLLTHRLRRLTGGNGDSTDPDISPDGTAVAFASAASDLVPGDTGVGADVFVLDLASGALTQVTRGDGPSGEPSLDRDASHVAFSSAATDLVEGDANARRDVFVATLGGGAPGVARLAAGGADVHESRAPHLSADGRTVVFDVVTTVPDGDATATRLDAVLARLSPPAAPVWMSVGDELSPWPWPGTDERGPSGGSGPTIDATGTTALYVGTLYDVAGASSSPLPLGGGGVSVTPIGGSALADDGIRAALDVAVSLGSGRSWRELVVVNRAAGTIARRCLGTDPDISTHGGIVVAEGGDIVVCR